MIGATRLPTSFLAGACDVLADTSKGLSGSDIVKLMRGYAMEYGVEIRHPVYPFDAPNKRTALLENLEAFSGPQQHRISGTVRQGNRLSARNCGGAAHQDRAGDPVQEYDTEGGMSAADEALIEETRHWLNGYPKVLELYNGAIGKFRSHVFQRNVLDDLRLALELLLRRYLCPRAPFAGYHVGNGPEFFAEAKKAGAEGIVSKRLGRPWKRPGHDLNP